MLMKKTIQSFFLKQAIRNFVINKKNINHKFFFNYDKTKKIGIIFNGRERKNIDLTRQLIDYFKEKNISCEALGFVNDTRMREFNLASLNMDYFNLKDCNFFGFPKVDKVINFNSKKFDILINISDEKNLIYDYIISKSLAKFRVGKDDCELYDLLINTKSGDSKDFVSEVIFYLDLISKNNQ